PFGKRSVWHPPLDDAKSHAFFVCMSHYGPRLILNQAKGATCTNTLYRAAFYAGVTATGRRALSLALISSFGQLSAEHHGRRYGAGMLKHEPSEAEAIRCADSSPSARSHRRLQARRCSAAGGGRCGRQTGGRQVFGL